MGTTEFADKAPKTKRTMVTDPAIGQDLDVSSLPKPGQPTGVVSRNPVTRTRSKELDLSQSGADQWWYCLGQNHGGLPIGDPGRGFLGKTEGCPTCPVCVDANGKNIQVNAIPIDNEGDVPDLEPRVAGE